MKLLTLNVKSQWFSDAKTGIKTEEYREVNEYWKKRLINADGSHKEFNGIRYKLGYPNSCDKSKILDFEWGGFEIKTIIHPHFNNIPTKVFAIKLIKPS